MPRETDALRCRVATALLLAFEQPLTSVRSHVPRENTALHRVEVTALFLAFERTLTRVRSHVHLEVRAYRRRMSQPSSYHRTADLCVFACAS